MLHSMLAYIHAMIEKYSYTHMNTQACYVREEREPTACRQAQRIEEKEKAIYKEHMLERRRRLVVVAEGYGRDSQPEPEPPNLKHSRMPCM